MTTARIRAQVQDAYFRDPSQSNTLKYVHDYLLAKAWYMAQIFPPSDESVRQLNTTICWFIWERDIFKVPIFPLQKEKEKGGWNLLNFASKCLALFLNRMRMQGMRTETVTADCLRNWNIQTQGKTPSFKERTLVAQEYLQYFETESAYVPQQGLTESLQTYKRRLYATMLT